MQVFKELIGLLQKAKKPEDIDMELTDHLINAAISTTMRQVMLDDEGEELSDSDALSIARNHILDHIDAIRMSFIMEDLQELGE